MATYTVTRTVKELNDMELMEMYEKEPFGTDSKAELRAEVVSRFNRRSACQCNQGLGQFWVGQR